MVDSHGPTETVRSWANGDDTSAVVQVEHDNEADDGRTVTVSVDSCEFPDLDRNGVTYRIGTPNSVSVAVTTAGPVEPDPNTYTVTLDRVEWSTTLRYPQSRVSMMFHVYVTIEPAANWQGDVTFTWSETHESDAGRSGTADIHFWKGMTAASNGILVPMRDAGTELVANVTLTSAQLNWVRVEGEYYKPPSTYVLGDVVSGSDTLIAPEYNLPDPVYTSSMSPDPVTEGESVSFTVTVADPQVGQHVLETRDNWRIHVPWTTENYYTNRNFQLIVLQAHRDGLSQTFSRTVGVCCDGDGWVPEADRPVQRTFSAYVYEDAAPQGTLATSASVNVGS